MKMIIRELLETFLPAHKALGLPEQGSTSVGGLLAVYAIASKLNSKVIVESGTFVGASLHALRQAVPQAELWSFDVSFGPLLYLKDDINYIEQDWSENDGPIKNQIAIFVFLTIALNNAKKSSRPMRADLDLFYLMMRQI